MILMLEGGGKDGECLETAVMPIGRVLRFFEPPVGCAIADVDPAAVPPSFEVWDYVVAETWLDTVDGRWYGRAVYAPAEQYRRAAFTSVSGL